MHHSGSGTNYKRPEEPKNAQSHSGDTFPFLHSNVTRIWKKTQSYNKKTLLYIFLKKGPKCTFFLQQLLPLTSRCRRHNAQQGGGSVKTLKYHYGFCVIYLYSLIIFWICCAFKIHQWCLGKILYKKNKSEVHINISLTNESSLFVGRFGLNHSIGQHHPTFFFFVCFCHQHLLHSYKPSSKRGQT